VSQDLHFARSNSLKVVTSIPDKVIHYAIAHAVILVEVNFETISVDLEGAKGEMLELLQWLATRT
jgi:hypothetical protein